MCTDFHQGVHIINPYTDNLRLHCSTRTNKYFRFICKLVNTNEIKSNKTEDSNPVPSLAKRWILPLLQLHTDWQLIVCPLFSWNLSIMSVFTRVHFCTKIKLYVHLSAHTVPSLTACLECAITVTGLAMGASSSTSTCGPWHWRLTIPVTSNSCNMHL